MTLELNPMNRLHQINDINKYIEGTAQECIPFVVHIKTFNFRRYTYHQSVPQYTILY